jgi:membrane protein YqaA with SNARE-associated domain
LVWTTLLALAGLVGITAAIGILAREPLFRVGKEFVAALGGVGVALGYLIPDALNLPLPNDLVSLLGRAGGMPFAAVVLWGYAGSLLGGCCGYAIGRALSERPVGQRFFAGRGARLRARLEHDGSWVLALFAVTPLPFSLAAWAAGAARMDFRRFLLISQLRLLRVGLYLYLIELGLLSVSL